LAGNAPSPAGYPERLAWEALGRNSANVHRAYARKAKMAIAASLWQGTVGPANERCQFPLKLVKILIVENEHQPNPQHAHSIR
jgi:hypothetical protein